MLPAHLVTVTQNAKSLEITGDLSIFSVTNARYKIKAVTLLSGKGEHNEYY